MMPTLFIGTVSKRYERNRWALREFSLRMEAGVLGLVGSNGAGKTTLLKMLATLLLPTEGSITWNGQDILRHPEMVRRVLGYVPQDFGVYPQISARMFLRYLGELKGLRGTQLRQRIDAVLEMVGLSADADRRLKTFSGGMVRRLGIAQALLNEPRLLVLDEPTVGLDPAERVRFREMLPSLSGERIVILSTHIISDIEVTATHLALLSQGRLNWTGTPEALLADAAGALWTLTIPQAEFERWRARYRVSSAIPRGGRVEMRILATHQPHPQAIPAHPTLEEAYLLFQEAMGPAERAEAFASPTQVP
ncbi:ATP-binding cassette domain-containing protein [Ktedonospora formicarum]|uniref:ABC transporter ATP-binding protein n=1 Tax=Ktedonospora formicarum TaxID=2778364 RepID=A0A8J3I4R8_9CHLR|nr:ATP-binding cassette domain-containing protein [Ktedonospora formicarum]GHO47476.1 ABC transporter ATP-binding protein [Ktedonospora formicarum]